MSPNQKAFIFRHLSKSNLTGLAVHCQNMCQLVSESVLFLTQAFVLCSVLAITLSCTALAQDVAPQIPTEEEKVAALKLGYRLNGNSMVGIGSIDLTDPRVQKAARELDAPPALVFVPEPVKKKR